MLENYLCRVDDSPFLAIERALDNGTGRCLVVNDRRELLGEITLDAMRAAVKAGDWLASATLARQITPCPHKVLVNNKDNARDLPTILTPVVDADNVVVDVVVNYTAEFVPVAQPQLRHQEFRYLMDAFLSTWISSTGEYIRTFESQFAAKTGMKQGVATSNGTVSLHLAMLALGIGPGDEVIVPDFTFAASINTITYCGATPVIVDVDPHTWCLAAETFERAITPRTKAVMPVHVFGRTAAMTEIVAIAKEHNIAVIEDCAEAHGAKYDGKYVGSFSEISSFSFFANKIITTGEGGMCLTDNPELADKMRVLRDHGMRPERRYWHEQVGYNYRMTNMQASIGLAQLERMDAILEGKKALSAMYREALSGIPGITLPPSMPSRAEPVVWFVCAQVPADKRAALIAAGKDQNIDIRPFFNALSAMPAYKEWAQPVPVSRALSVTGINLPTSHRVDANVVDRVAELCRRVLT